MRPLYGKVGTVADEVSFLAAGGYKEVDDSYESLVYER
jgi:hypothetical protein